MPIRWWRLRLVIVCVIALAGSIWVPPVRAGISLSVTPALADLVASPGATGSHRLLLTNSGSDRLVVDIQITPLPEAPQSRSAVPWLSLAASQYTLEPGDQIPIEIGIAVPRTVVSGGYYARVAMTARSAASAGTDLAIGGQLQAGILLTITGDDPLIRKGAITGLVPVFERDGRIRFELVVENRGNVHLIPGSGHLAITTDSGQAVGTLEFEAARPVLPETGVVLVSHGSLPLDREQSYHAVVRLPLGDLLLEAETTFTVNPALAIGAVGICENLDRGPTISIPLENPGDVLLTPLVTIELRDATGHLLGQPLLPALRIGPHEAPMLMFDYPDRLESGTYQLDTTVTYDPDQPALEQNTGFQIGGTTGSQIPRCSTTP